MLVVILEDMIQMNIMYEETLTLLENLGNPNFTMKMNFSDIFKFMVFKLLENICIDKDFLNIKNNPISKSEF